MEHTWRNTLDIEFENYEMVNLASGLIFIGYSLGIRK